MHLLARVLHLVVGASCGRSVVVFLDPLVCIVGMVVKKAGFVIVDRLSFLETLEKKLKSLYKSLSFVVKNITKIIEVFGVCLAR